MQLLECHTRWDSSTIFSNSTQLPDSMPLTYLAPCSAAVFAKPGGPAKSSIYNVCPAWSNLVAGQTVSFFWVSLVLAKKTAARLGNLKLQVI